MIKIDFSTFNISKVKIHVYFTESDENYSRDEERRKCKEMSDNWLSSFWDSGLPERKFKPSSQLILFLSFINCKSLIITGDFHLRET